MRHRVQLRIDTDGIRGHGEQIKELRIDAFAQVLRGLGGQRVLDLGCGDGTTAVPAAQLSSPDGSWIRVADADDLERAEALWRRRA